MPIKTPHLDEDESGEQLADSSQFFLSQIIFAL